MKKTLFVLLFSVLVVCCTTEKTLEAPTQTLAPATVVEVKEAKTYWYPEDPSNWYAEIEIVFSQTPRDLEIMNTKTKHFMRKQKEQVGPADEQVGDPNAGFASPDPWWTIVLDWEQTEKILTIDLTFQGKDLLATRKGGNRISYEQAKARYPNIDWNDFVAYTLYCTLDWNTGRKRVEVPIKPTQQIIERFSK